MALILIPLWAVFVQVARTALILVLRRVLLRYGGVLVVAAVKAFADELKKWVRENLPQLVVSFINFKLGTEFNLPLDPLQLTREVNKKLGEDVFTDVLDREAVAKDVAMYAIKRVQDASGLVLPLEYFSGSVTSQAMMKRTVRVWLEAEIKKACEEGGTPLIPAEQVQQLLLLARDGYVFTPHVNQTSERHQVGREMAKWMRAHAVRVRSRV